MLVCSLIYGGLSDKITFEEKELAMRMCNKILQVE